MAIGVPYELFWHLNPKKLKPFQDAYKRKQQEMDAYMHLWWGTYGISAVSYAVEHCLVGKKASLEYIKEPVLNKAHLSQEELDNLELQKMILAEEMWIKNDKKRGLEETLIRKQEQIKQE